MNLIKKLIHWRVNLILIFVILLLLSVSNFYGLFTNKFYFLKPDNYVFPLLSIIHFVYLHAIWFKITEKEMPDRKMLGSRGGRRFAVGRETSSNN